VKIANDIEGMQLALKQAELALFITSPNPRVGCVIVKEGVVLAQGHTQAAGQAHAEVAALRDASSRGVDVRGATVYVSLEPCSHHGRTPPCTDSLINSGVARVVVAIADPNPLVAGKGLALLQAAGITTEVGLLAAEAREMNIGFFMRMQLGRPWVRMKIAASLDGGTALLNGASQWITSEPARTDGHAWRARACALLTGMGTVEQDDPQLTVRAVSTPRQPRRIVLDSQLQISPTARVLEGGGTWIVSAERHDARESELMARGSEIIHIPSSEGKVNLHALMQELGKREINELHIEAGYKLNGSLLRAGCVDELLIYLAPCLLGPSQGMARLPELTELSSRVRLQFHQVLSVGSDLRILARLTPAS
jgi:diaminohydroxyphosphoribosylaminopyrimidine deaminase/5-amino-6-(5-phosphoribosylamino)uracil reductase